MAQPCTASLRPRIPVCSRGSNVAWLVVSLLWHRTTAQFAAQVLIEPTVDPESVLASVGTRAGPRGGLKPSGFSDGKGGRFDGPLGVAFSPDGHTYVADSRNHAIRRVGGDGGIDTIAGGRGPGLSDGIGDAARFFNPCGIAVGPQGELYVADTSNNAVRHVVPSSRSVTTIYHSKSYSSAEPQLAAALAAAAQTSPPPASYTYEGAEPPPPPPPPVASAVSSGAPQGLWNPSGIVAWPTSPNEARVLVADTDNHRLLLLTPPAATGGVWALSLFAGAGIEGFADGLAAHASFSYPRGLALCDVNGVYQLLVADSGNHAVRVVAVGGDDGTAGASVTTLAGVGTPGDEDSRTRREKPKASILITTRLPARFAQPMGVACDDGHGGAVVADAANQRVRQIRADGVTVTVAGASARGHADGRGDQARFDGPVSITRDDAHKGRYIVGEQGNAALRQIDLRSGALVSAARRRAAGAGQTAAAVIAIAVGMLGLGVGGRRRHLATSAARVVARGAPRPAHLR